MISIDTQVSGETIGYKLSQDAEEMAYALKSLSDDADDNFGTEVGEFLSGDYIEVVEFLRKLADQIEVAHAA